jgi:hypothetical protein
MNSLDFYVCSEQINRTFLNKNDFNSEWIISVRGPGVIKRRLDIYWPTALMIDIKKLEFKKWR